VCCGCLAHVHLPTPQARQAPDVYSHHAPVSVHNLQGVIHTLHGLWQQACCHMAALTCYPDLPHVHSLSHTPAC
jgi:hypothetical protein